MRDAEGLQLRSELLRVSLFCLCVLCVKAFYLTAGAELSRHDWLRIPQRILADPVVLALHLVELVIVLAESVALSGVEHQLDRLAAIFQRAVELHGLTCRHALIAAAV